ncbi:hypothetical protein J6E39_06470 [bacterium]|nr:hypothetical protein [bacterium]
MSLIQNIKSNYGKYLCRGAGIAALGIVAYDAHVMAKLRADVEAKSKDADACYDRFNNTQYLSTPSTTISNAKKGVYHLELDNNIRSFFNSGIGYVKGALSTMVSEVVPFTLGLGALLGKGIIAKGSAIGLGIYAGICLAKDVLGFGHYNDLNKPY